LGSLLPYVASQLERYAFQHRSPTRDERDRTLLDMNKAVYEDHLPASEPARRPIGGMVGSRIWLLSRRSKPLGRIKIHEVVCTLIVGKFIEGYTAIAWSPAAGT